MVADKARKEREILEDKGFPTSSNPAAMIVYPNNPSLHPFPAPGGVPTYPIPPLAALPLHPSNYFAYQPPPPGYEIGPLGLPVRKTLLDGSRRQQLLFNQQQYPNSGGGSGGVVVGQQEQAKAVIPLNLPLQNNASLVQQQPSPPPITQPAPNNKYNISAITTSTDEAYHHSFAPHNLAWGSSPTSNTATTTTTASGTTPYNGGTASLPPDMCDGAQRIPRGMGLKDLQVGGGGTVEVNF